jgi:hypothetical protein
LCTWRNHFDGQCRNFISGFISLSDHDVIYVSKPTGHGTKTNPSGLVDHPIPIKKGTLVLFNNHVRHSGAAWDEAVLQKLFGKDFKKGEMEHRLRLFFYLVPKKHPSVHKEVTYFFDEDEAASTKTATQVAEGIHVQDVKMKPYNMRPPTLSSCPISSPISAPLPSPLPRPRLYYVYG